MNEAVVYDMSHEEKETIMSERRPDWFLQCYDDKDPVLQITFSPDVCAMLEGEDGIIKAGGLVHEAYRHYKKVLEPERRAKCSQ